MAALQDHGKIIAWPGGQKFPVLSFTIVQPTAEYNSEIMKLSVYQFELTSNR